MTRCVFLHIGLPKTGTTYLQDVLWRNRDDLREDGVLLPGGNRRRHLLASLDVREDPKLARRPGDVAAPWQGLVEEMLGWDGDAVVSHEFFAAASPEQVRRVADSLADRVLHVVITARRMSELGPSRWQEWVKSGGTLPVDAWPARRDYDPTSEWGWGSFDLADILDRWSTVVPPARIHVLPVRRSAPPEELWHEFAALIGAYPSRYSVPERPANRSLGLVEVELLRRVNAELTDFRSAPDRGNWIRGYLAEGKVMPSRSERFRAGEETQRELVDRGNRAVQMLRTGGFDLRGDLRLLEPSFVTGVRHPDEVGDQELVGSATITIANMLRSVRELTAERDELRRRVAALEAAAAAPAPPRRGLGARATAALGRLRKGSST